MIRHIVMWTLNDGADGKTRTENAEKMVYMLNSLYGKIPGIVSLEARINENYKDLQPYDVVLNSVFESWESLEKYQTHPEHLKVVEFVKKIRKDRSAVDYSF